MVLAIELLKLFAILIGYLILGVIAGGFALKFILSKYKIRVKDIKKVYFIPSIVYAMSILSQVMSSYFTKIFNLIFLVLTLFLVYYLVNKFFTIKKNKKAIIPFIWILSFFVINIIIGILLVIVLLLLRIPIRVA